MENWDYSMSASSTLKRCSQATKSIYLTKRNGTWFKISALFNAEEKIRIKGAKETILPFTPPSSVQLHDPKRGTN